MSNDLYASSASNAKILALECVGDLGLASKAKALRDQSADGVTTAQGANSGGTLLQGNRHTASKEGLQE
jgi:hypothetical protein